MPEVFIGAGSNADPERRLRFGVAELERRLGALRCSRVYRSAAVGVPAADYSNVVVAFDTELAVDALRDALRAIEAAAGRSRADPAVCELDLDLLLHGGRVDVRRRLPRPGLFTLPFVLVPLAELAPALRHPVTGERSSAAARRLAPGSVVDLGALGARAERFA
jgi:2-amino-4-hydroxy-6-hydroxymethyldihydropteridine diphosphokinase